MSNRLEAERDHARNMANQAFVPDNEKRLWRQIADEITAYLDGGDEGPEAGQEVAA